ncbi:hypothetical protein HC028_07805 [Planosporangium flavigriseum]|uniref:Uncharacterized protein n=1 Tax=Planosporangium flavigriseum TaxID=373681 RepID=A0A8J3LKA1_9ACTN|nr:hypothetical protein [Planosporangium flavigriseum]NJC64414.1 hypothetical protein [Planosporangium flavigriseum]GIG72110.1 hypothetical protein Pfl04_05140 [Planosporangium flavigriseum]
MYSWIWRHLPFGLPGRIIGSLLIVGSVAALLWYQVFPDIEQYMPFTDGQIAGTAEGGEAPSGAPGGADVVTPPSASPGLPPPDVIPYSTVSNEPAPTATR